MASITVHDSAAVELATSVHGDFLTPTEVTLTVLGAGTLYVGYSPSVTAANGLPYTAGLYISLSLKAGKTLYGIASTGATLDVRTASDGPV